MSLRRPHHVYAAHGTAILRRLDALTAPGAVVTAWTDKFRAIHSALLIDEAAVASAFAARHDAIAVVVAREHDLEQALAPLLDELPGAGVGDRRNPLRDVSTYTPADLHGLGHKKLALETAAIVAKVRATAKKKKTDLAPLLDALAAAAAVLTSAVDAVPPLDDAYHAAVRTRDAAFVDWSSTLGKLQRRVEIHFEATPDEAAAIFAPPAPIEADVGVGAAARRRPAEAVESKDKKAAKAAGKQAEKAALEAAKAERAAKKSAKKAAKASAMASARDAEKAAKKARDAAKAVGVKRAKKKG